MRDPLEQIRAVAARVAASHGLEIWDVQSRREAEGHVVRIVIDRPGPAATPEESVGIEDCEQVNREVGAILDVEDPLPFAYTLEVSSPGLDRPLRHAADYARFAGRLAKIVVREAVDNQKAFAGRLRGVEEGAVLLEAPGGRTYRLPLALITRGRLEVEFQGGRRSPRSGRRPGTRDRRPETGGRRRQTQIDLCRTR